MTNLPRLAVTEPVGQRMVPIETLPFAIGRRPTAHLQIRSQDVSREHAEITRDGDAYLIRDVGSRFGTFVNGTRLSSARLLAHGDHIGLGRTDGIDLVFLFETTEDSSLTGPRTTRPDLQQLAAVLNGLRALGSGRVLDEVLTLVLESALEVTTADRGGIMLAGPSGELEMKVACGRNRRPLPELSFVISEKIPREVYETGRSQMLGDLQDRDVRDSHDRTLAAGIRHVLCVPLTVAPIGAGEPQPETPSRIIGVLYLDGRERSSLLSPQTRSSLDAFAMQAALAIDSARLYAEAAEKARLEQELLLAAKIQYGLLPSSRYATSWLELAATAVPCRTIGGDFFDYLDLPDGHFGFVLGDVAGKGPSAALLAAAVQSNVAAHATTLRDPGETMTNINRALLRRAIEARFATMFYGVLAPGGRLAYCNAGQEPPLVVRSDGRVDWLDPTGPVVGILDFAEYGTGVVSLHDGDLLIVYSDGITEASNAAGEEFGRDRLSVLARGRHGDRADQLLDRLVASVNDFVGAAPQADDLTVLVLRYAGAGAR